MTRDNGGPAFPMPSGAEPRMYETTHYNEGMSLWDYYFGLAMQGAITNPTNDGFTCEKVAQFAAEFVDAMMAERKKRQ